MKEYPVQRAAVLKPKPDPDTLVFGKTFTDHMFIMDYTAGQGWHDGRIVPYGPLALEPSAMVLHYAQEVFEGLKAYRSPDGWACTPPTTTCSASSPARWAPIMPRESTR